MSFIDSSTTLSAVLTLLGLITVGLIFKLFIRPFLQIRAYKNIPGVMASYRLGSRVLWQNRTSAGQPIKANRDSAFYVTETNSLLIDNPDLKAIVTNLAHKTQITLIDHNIYAEMIKNHERYIHFLRNTMLGTRYVRYAMVASTGNDWKRQRKIISGAFDFQSMKKIVPIIQEAADEFFRKETLTKEGEAEIGLQSTFLEFTWEALSRSFFGDDLQQYTLEQGPFSKTVNSLVKGQFRVLMTAQFQIFGEWAAVWNSDIREERRKIISAGKFAEKIIDEMSEKIKRGELKNPDGRKGILELILENSKDDSLTNRELLGNFFSFSFAGTDTSANTSTALLYCIATNPDKKQKVIDEINANWDGHSPLTMDILNKLEFLHASILETLRVMSPAPFLLPRVAACDHMVGDIPVKKGYLIQAFFNPTLFTPKYIKNPGLFLPERWMKGSEYYQHMEDVYVFNPFSFGPRTCIGQHFATTQIKVALCHFLTRFDFELPEGYTLPPMVRRATMEPREPIKMRIRPKA